MPQALPPTGSAVKRAPRPVLLGHRGARKAAPENTLAAFDLALAHGCDGFEFDVRRTADGEAVVLHDATVAGMEVAATEYEQLRQAQGGKEGLGPPTLEQVLARYADRAVLDIEVKVRGLEERVVGLLRKYPPQREYVVSSFHPEVLVALRLKQADLPLGFICERSYALVAWPKLPIKYVMPRLDLMTKRRMDKLHNAGKKVFVWTVNEPKDMLRLAAAGADAIISDDTELLVRTLGRRG
ncbi:MAG TPA: glycerophosphodiester phosphodiesterase [Terriglobales bacterium]|nr:glycerophosphodiester phosphodiesterase [Terriglobales bacterium]